MRLEIEVLFQPLSDLRFAIQRNPYATTATTEDNSLVMSHTFDSLTFYACVLDTPAEILRSQNPGIDGTVLSHMVQVANMNNFSFHNVFKCFKFPKPSLSSSAANTHRFDILNSVRRIWLQVSPEPAAEGLEGFGCRDWTQSVVYAYSKAMCNYFIDAQWNYVNCVMGFDPNAEGELAWERFRHSRTHHNAVWQDREWQGDRYDFMTCACVLTWAYDTDFMDRYRIMERQIVSYKIEWAADYSDDAYKAQDFGQTGSAPTFTASKWAPNKTYSSGAEAVSAFTMESEAIVWANQLGEASVTEPAPIAYLGAFPGSIGVLDAMALTRDFLTDGVYGRIAMQGEPQVDRIPPR